MPKKSLFLIGVVIIVGAVGFFAFNSYIYNEKQNGGVKNVEPYRGTLTGKYVCLPHTDKEGPQTLECALGMRTESGEHYALDFAAMSQLNPGLKTGDTFSANGLITPIENLSSDHWKKYDVVGIFSVTDSVTIL